MTVEKAKSLDISELKTTERLVDITHPKTGENIGVQVSLMAISDPRMKKIKRSIQDQKLRLEARGKNFKSEDIEENTYAVIFAAMTGWTWGNDANFKGKKPEFTKVNVYEVFNELPWFLTQVDEAIGDEKAFF